MSKRRKKRDVFVEPTDPKFRDQWYLVSTSTAILYSTKDNIFLVVCISVGHNSATLIG